MLHSLLALGFSAGEQPTFAAPPSDYILLENRDMDSSWSGKSHRWNQYVVPGYAGGVSPSPKSVALGHEKTDADLELAKHLCDRYDSCDHFNSLHYVGPGSGGSPSDYIPAYPGEIGSFKPQPKADTYLKGSIGEVVPGSCAYPCARYFHLTNVSSQKKTRGWCNHIANGPAAGSSVDSGVRRERRVRWLHRDEGPLLLLPLRLRGVPDGPRRRLHQDGKLDGRRVRDVVRVRRGEAPVRRRCPGRVPGQGELRRQVPVSGRDS